MADKRDRSPEPRPRQKEIYLVHYSSIGPNGSTHNVEGAFDSVDAAATYCTERSKAWPVVQRDNYFWVCEELPLGRKNTLHYFSINPTQLRTSPRWAAYLAVGSQVRVRAYPENFDAVVRNNIIKVQGVHFAADTVISATNGWEIGSVLTFVDGQKLPIDKCPKIYVDWLKPDKSNKPQRVPCRRKVELVSIKN